MTADDLLTPRLRLRRWHPDDYEPMAAINRDPAVTFVGVAYPTFLPELASRPELGWRLGREAWGHGFATEAAAIARDDAFASLRLPELISIERQVPSPVLDLEIDVWTLQAPA